MSSKIPEFKDGTDEEVEAYLRKLLAIDFTKELEAIKTKKETLLKKRKDLIQRINEAEAGLDDCIRESTDISERLHSLKEKLAQDVD